MRLDRLELEHLDENPGAAEIKLTADELREIDSALSKIKVQPDRLPKEHMDLIDR
jgi:hypothetical protein